MDIIVNLVAWVTLIVTVASLVAASTPTPKDDKIWAKVYTYLEVLALAIGKAKDKNPLLKK